MRTRREVVIGGGSLTAALALAGCSAIPGVGDGDDEFEFGEFSDYREWLPDTSGRPHELIVVNPSAVVDVNVLDDGNTIFGTPTARVAHLIRADVGTENLVIAIGDFDVEGARDGFETQEDLSTEDASEYSDFQLYDVTATGESTATEYETFATKSDIAIAGSDQSLVERVIDAEAGSGTRLVDAAEDFGTVAGEIGNDHWMEFTMQPAGVEPDESGPTALVTGLGFDIEPDESEFTVVRVYDTAEAAGNGEETALQQWTEQRDGTTDVESEVDGRVVIVTGTQSTDKLF